MQSMNPFTSLSGPDEVKAAVAELSDLQDQQFTATLGEPDIQRQPTRYFSDPKVVIPLRDTPFNGANQLVFDVPSWDPERESALVGLLDALDTDLSNVERVEGQEVPMQYVSGNAAVMWGLLREESEPDQDSDDGGEDSPGVTTETTTVAPDDEEN